MKGFTVIRLLKSITECEVKMEEFFDEDNIEIESMRDQRKKLHDKEFGKLINKRDLSDFELDELFNG